MPYRSGFRQRLALVITLTGGCVLAALMLNRFFLIRDIITERLRIRMAAISTVLQESILDDLADRDTLDLQETIRWAADEAGIRFIMLADTGGNAVFSSGGIPADRSLAVYSFAFPGAARYGIASLRIGMVRDRYRRDIRTALYWSLGLSLLGLGIIAAASWLVSGRLLSPLTDMKHAAGLIARGDFAIRVPDGDPDEIGALAAALNTMAARLGSYTENLEKQVQAATAGLQRAVAELERNNIRLQELDRLKSEFVSMVSHELKSPLAVMIGYGELLQDPALPAAERNRLLARIESEGRRLAVLIDESLDISLIESGNMHLRPVPADMGRLVRDTAAALPVPAGATLTVDTGDGAHPLRCDADKVRQAVTNLITNAFKYAGDACTVTVTVRSEAGTVRVDVADNGPGIPPEEREKIFRRFYRMHTDVERGIKGTGLGLAIVEGIIRLHGGTVRVESEPGCGSTFIFSVPASPEPRPERDA